MSLFSLKELKKSSIYLTPNFPSLQTKRYKFSFFKALLFVIIFSMLIGLITAAVFVFTPAKEILFFVENEKLSEKAEEIKVLEKKINVLTQSLNSISSSTAKLKYAMMLGQIDSLDSNTLKIYDSLKKSEDAKSKISPEGYVYKAFKNFINRYFETDSTKNSLGFINPSDGIIINYYNELKGHLGIDYALKPNSPVFSSQEGIVIFSGYDIDDGYSIILNHENEFITKYKHCSQLLVKEREYVKQGEIIALSGNSGFNTSGPHLHFEIWKNGFSVDPNKYLTSEGEPNGE